MEGDRSKFKPVTKQRAMKTETLLSVVDGVIFGELNETVIVIYS
jgi:hypothetical protein